MNGEREREKEKERERKDKECVWVRKQMEEKKENWKIQRAIKSITEAKKEFIFCFVLGDTSSFFLYVLVCVCVSVCVCVCVCVCVRVCL